MERSRRSSELGSGALISSTYFSQEVQGPPRKDQEDGDQETAPLPDGGYGWVVAALALLLNAFLTMGLSSFSILFVEFVDYFGASKTQVSWLAAIYMAAMLATCGYAQLMPVLGVRLMGCIAASLTSVAFFTSSFVTDLRILYVTFALIPGSMLCYYGLAGIVTLHRWFDKHISLAMAINFSGIALGHFVWAPLTSWFIDQYSWRGALMLLSAINLNSIVLFILLKTPEQYYSQPNTKKAEVESTAKNWLKQLLPDICKKPSYILFHLLNIVFNMAYLVGMSYLPTRYALSGGSRQTSALLQAIVGVTMGVLRPVHGFIGDKVSKQRTWLFFVYEGASGAALVLSAFFDHFAWIAFCGVLFASFAAGYVVITLPTITDLWGRDEIAHIGAHLYVDGAIAGLILHPLSGYLMDMTGRASAPFLLFGSLQVAAMILGLFLQYKRKKQLSPPNDPA